MAVGKLWAGLCHGYRTTPGISPLCGCLERAHARIQPAKLRAWPSPAAGSAVSGGT